MLYKKDDRPEGTTINDRNRTRINLVGLNREEIHIFPLSALIIGIGYDSSQALKFNLSLEKQYISFLRQPSTQEPGQNPNDPFVARQLIKLLVMYQKAKLHLFTGVVFADQKMDFSTGSSDNLNKRVFDTKKKDLWFGVGSYL